MSFDEYLWTVKPIASEHTLRVLRVFYVCLSMCAFVC